MSQNRVSFLDVGYTYHTIQDEIDTAIHRVLRSGQYIGGNEVSIFETNFAKFVDANHCVGVGNGLDAITLSLRALGVGPGDEVIVPSHTFIATWLAVSETGATPVPVEPELNGYNIDPTLIEAAITKKTKAIIMVHLYGQPCDIDEILSIASQHGLRVIEDAAQAHGATYKGQRIGGHSDVVTWSFYPGKNLGAFGDGGAVTTNDQDLAEKIRILGNYGSEHKYDHSELGLNSRLDPVQAAILDVKLKFLQSWNQKRTETAKIYIKELKGTGLQLPVEKHSSSSAWHLFVIRTKARKKLQAHLTNSGVESLIHYPKPPNKQKCYFQEKSEQVFLRAETIADEVLSIPIGPHLDLKAAYFVSEAIKAFDQFRV